jgi:hypothetical protein
MDDFLEESDGDRQAIQAKRNEATSSSIIKEMATRQAPFLDLVEQFHKLFWELPNLTTRDVDQRLQPMFDKLMDAAATVGISRMSVPSLKECCGKKRVWPDDLNKSQVVPAVPRDAGGLGDILKKTFSWFGATPCEGCERRRKWLNSIRWPWQK